LTESVIAIRRALESATPAAALNRHPGPARPKGRLPIYAIRRLERLYGFNVVVVYYRGIRL
jgi:hypothetical protein